MTAISEPIIETASALPQPTLRTLALRGTIWTVIGYGSSQCIRLISNLIITRLLVPSIFGEIALVQIFLQGLGMFSDFGVGPSVIRAKSDDPEFLNTAWTIQFLRGLVLALLCIALADPMARFYHLPQLRYLIMICSLQAIIDGSQSISLQTQNKKLAMRNLTIISLGSQLSGITAMIISAYFLRNVWALMISMFVGVSANTLGSHLFLPGIPARFCWNKAVVKELFHFGKWIFVSTILTFVALQADRLMLGKIVPLSVLGIYSVALTLATLPNNVIVHIASLILYPIFAKNAASHNAAYIKRVLKTRRMLLPIGIVIVTGLSTIAKPFFHLLYDPRYADAGWMAQMLSIYVWFWMLQTSADRALIALGDTRSVAVSNLVNVVTTFAGCLIGYHIWKMPGFIIGLSFSSLAAHLVIEIALYRHGINIFLQDIVSTVIAGALAAVAISVGFVVSNQVGGAWHYPTQWIVENIIIAGAGVFVATHVQKLWREVR